MEYKIFVLNNLLLTSNKKASSHLGGASGVITYVLIIAFVIGLAFYVTKLLSKVNIFSGSSKYMKVIDKLMISNDKSLILVKVNDRVEMLSINKSGVVKVDDFSAEDFPDMTEKDESTLSFKNILLKRKEN